MTNAQSAPSMATVHDNVRAEIARAHRSQADVAFVLGMTQGSVSRRLAGRVEFSASELSKLSALLDVPVSTFFDSVPGDAA